MAVVQDSTYQPQWRAQLNSADVYGSYNCTAYAAGFAADYATFGEDAPTGAIIRRYSNEPIPKKKSPGLNLDQVGDVLRDRFDVALNIRLGIPFDDFVDNIDNGAGGILQISYAPVLGTKVAGSYTFSGGHAWFVPPGFDVLDPLADGRISSGRRVHRYDGTAYDKTLLRNAAGSLVIGEKNGRPYTVRERYGNGYCWAAFTTAHEVPAHKPPIGPTAYGDNVMFQAYGVTGPHTIKVKAGQLFYRSNSVKGGTVTKASKAAVIPYLGYAGSGFGAVIVGTGSPYADHKTRPTVVYMPIEEGVIT